MSALDVLISISSGLQFWLERYGDHNGELVALLTETNEEIDRYVSIKDDNRTETLDAIISTEKDYEINSEMHISDWKADAARAELAALRAKIELQAGVIKDMAQLLIMKRAENTELREALNGAECAASDALATVDAQARQLAEARIAITESLDSLELEGSGEGFTASLCRAWLSANAPPPSSAQFEATAPLDGR